jgi:hypothetical protein
MSSRIALVRTSGSEAALAGIRLASVLVDPEVRTNEPETLTNFGVGTLADGTLHHNSVEDYSSSDADLIHFRDPGE